MKILVFFFISILSLPAFSTELHRRLQAAQGKTFSALGPNCFATALKLAGVLSSFRGMDAKEFEYIQKNFCQRVTEPQAGDVGVFEAPGFGAIHAYLYVSPQMGMQKPGVDYNGKTPISFQPLESILYTFLASPECRRYAKDISECANQHYYIRCNSFADDLKQLNPTLESKIQEIESRIDALLESEIWGSAQKELSLQVQQEVMQLGKALGALEKNSAMEYILARQVSLEKQAQFLVLKSK